MATRGHKRDATKQAILDSFARLPIGASVFIAGARRADVEALRQPLIVMGVGVTIACVQHDTVHGCAGVRLWRKHGEYDEL
jgi:hypothetical protein